MIKTTLTALALVMTASSSFAMISFTPSSSSAITDDGTNGGGETNNATPVLVCNYSGNSTLGSVSYTTDGGGKHYLYNMSDALLDGTLTTSGYSKVNVDTTVDVADTLGGHNETTQVKVSITQGGGTAKTINQIATGGSDDLKWAAANSDLNTVVGQEAFDILNADIDIRVDELIIESTTGFGKFVASPRANVTLSCVS